MTFTVEYSEKFSEEFVRFPEDQQLKVAAFALLFQTHGLGDFSKYEGKITPSWQGLAPSDQAYVYASSNSLWHYHIGHPAYTQSIGPYKTSDWVLHFQWVGKGPKITLVDMYAHYTTKGDFYLPPPSYLGT